MESRRVFSWLIYNWREGITLDLNETRPWFWGTIYFTATYDLDVFKVLFIFRGVRW